MKIVKIDECDEGYVVSDLELVGDNGLKILTKHAVSKDKLVQKVKELLGITDKKLEKPIVLNRIDKLRTAAEDMIKANPDPFISDSSNSTYPHVNLAMTGDVKPERPAEPFCEKVSPKTQSKIETKLSPSSPTFTFSEIGAFEVSVQPITTGNSLYWLHPGGKKIKISRKSYPIMIYAKISDLVYLYEHPTEQKPIIHAYGKATYENKAVVLRGFMKEVPLSALNSDNHNDVVVPVKKEEPKGQMDGCCDDVDFETCANNHPNNCKFCIDQSRYENKNKIAAKKPAPPLMKASVPP